MRFLPCFGILALAVLASTTLQCSRSRPSDIAQRGWLIYDRMCAVCHGREGQGYAADQAPALGRPDFLASASDAYLRTAITFGRGGTTMSAWGRVRGGPLAPADVDALDAFIRSWDRGARANLDGRALAGDPTRGAGLYTRECIRCHGERGVAGPSVHIGGPDFLSSASDGYLRYAIRRGRAGTPMPGFAGALGDSGVEDIVALLRSWQAISGPAPVSTPPQVPPLPLGPLPIHPHGPDPLGFAAKGATTPADVIKAQLDRGARMALLDARAPSDYVTEHIAGAVSVPFYDPQPYFAALPRDVWLVCYCACPHAESGQLAQKLLAKGFTKVTVLDEGLPVWRARKYPTRSGIDP
jgi:cytochrome c oxidase cbb3-type subunit 3/ubiquinol-cytochrome c reductase cytochrome c subunit